MKVKLIKCRVEKEEIGERVEEKRREKVKKRMNKEKNKNIRDRESRETAETEERT
jgi:hypothetical protein